jgi:hypothetical protein
MVLYADSTRNCCQLNTTGRMPLNTACTLKLHSYPQQLDKCTAATMNKCECTAVTPNKKEATTANTQWLLCAYGTPACSSCQRQQHTLWQQHTPRDIEHTWNGASCSENTIQQQWPTMCDCATLQTAASAYFHHNAHHQACSWWR